ncbi:MAG: hypothetical protein IT209_07510 [Armatimonadetes bacterium]|nr:hypothetical protein [Armatimonadota bacterium]
MLDTYTIYSPNWHRVSREAVSGAVLARLAERSLAAGRCVALLAALLLAVGCAGAGASSANLLANPGFESGPLSPVQGWTLWRAPWGSGESAQATTAARVSGNRALVLTCNSSSFGVYQQVSVTPGRCYQLNGWWKGTFPTAPGNTSWYDTELLDGPFDYQTADIRPDDLPTKVCTYDPALVVWDWQHMSDAYSTAPICVNGVRVATGNIMTVVLKTGGFSKPYGYYDDMTLTEQPFLSVAQAKSQRDGAAVSLDSPSVSAVFDGFYYVQSGEELVGLRVVGSSLPLVGAKASVAGIMRTNADGERYLEAQYASFAPPGDTPRAFGMTCGTVGGASTGNYNSVSGEGQGGAGGGVGANNIGLLIRVAGRVVSVDSGARVFTLSDGSSSPLPVKFPASATPPGVGLLISVTGISSCALDGQAHRSLVLLRSGADIHVLAP